MTETRMNESIEEELEKLIESVKSHIDQLDRVLKKTIDSEERAYLKSQKNLYLAIWMDLLESYLKIKEKTL